MMQLVFWLLALLLLCGGTFALGRLRSPLWVWFVPLSLLSGVVSYYSVFELSNIILTSERAVLLGTFIVLLLWSCGRASRKLHLSQSRWFFLLLLPVTILHLLVTIICFGVSFGWGEQVQAVAGSPPLGLTILSGITYVLMAGGWVNLLSYAGFPDWAIYASFGITSLVESAILLWVIFFIRAKLRMKR